MKLEKVCSWDHDTSASESAPASTTPVSIKVLHSREHLRSPTAEFGVQLCWEYPNPDHQPSHQDRIDGCQTPPRGGQETSPRFPQARGGAQRVKKMSPTQSRISPSIQRTLRIKTLHNSIVLRITYRKVYGLSTCEKCTKSLRSAIHSATSAFLSGG